MKLTESSFRNLYHTFYIIVHDMKKYAGDENGIKAPEGANAVLVYPYIDRQAGFSFEVMAPASWPSCEVFYDYALIQVQNRRLTIRSGAIEEFEGCRLGNQDELRERFAKHCEMIDAYFSTEGIESTRKVELIDHLRHKDYPDDIEVALFADDGSAEIVWMRLEGMGLDEETGVHYLCGELLNQPYGKYEAVMGDQMSILLTKDNEGVIRAFTRDTMILDPRGRKRLEEFRSRRGAENGS